MSEYRISESARLNKQARRNERERKLSDATKTDQRPSERAAEAHQRIDREAYPYSTVRSGYAGIVGDIPTLQPGDRFGASQVLARICEAIGRGGWTRNEWRRLRELKAKWLRRARGGDERFNLVGNRRGGLTTAHMRQVGTVQRLQRLKQHLDNGGGEA